MDYKAFFKLLSDYNLKCGYSVDYWFDWLLDDCLASFDRKIPKDSLPPEEIRGGMIELSGAYAETVIHEPPFTDILGRAYMEIASRWKCKGMGQYFTPQPVAIMMAGLTLGKIPHDRLTTILEPCVGSGVMALAVIQKVAEQDIKRVECLSITGIDLDYSCARMFPLQVLANGLVHGIEVGQLLALQGNTLGDPKDWRVIIEGVHRRWYGLPTTPRVETLKQTVVHSVADKQPSPAIGEQLGLF